MIAFFYQWLQNIAFYLILITAIIQIIPNHSYKKYIRFFTGLILIVMLSEPIMKAIGMQMGYLDEQMQLGTIDLYLEQLSFVIEKAREELVMKKRLCNCLAVTGGIFLVIILI